MGALAAVVVLLFMLVSRKGDSRPSQRGLTKMSRESGRSEFHDSEIWGIDLGEANHSTNRSSGNRYHPAIPSGDTSLG